MPGIGVSTWTGFHSQILSPSDIEPVSPSLEATLHRAIDAGYRLFDAAACEGDNERILGAVIASRLAEHDLTRQDFFISTKLSSYSHRQQQVVPELQESLERLRLDYVDLYIMHLPFALTLSNEVEDSVAFVSAWRGLQDALRLNLTRSLGAAHADLAAAARLRTQDVPPHVMQIEVNLNLQQQPLLEFCSQHNIAVMSVHPHGSLYSVSRDVTAAPLPRLDDPLLAGFGNKYMKTVPQVALRFLVEKHVIPLISPRSSYQLQESFDIFDFTLHPFEMFLLKSFNNGFRTLDFKYWSHAKYYPFKRDQATRIRENMYPGYYNVTFPIQMYDVKETTQAPPLSDI